MAVVSMCLCCRVVASVKRQANTEARGCDAKVAQGGEGEGLNLSFPCRPQTEILHMPMPGADPRGQVAAPLIPGSGCASSPSHIQRNIWPQERYAAGVSRPPG